MIIRVFFKMMFKILLNHIFCQFSRGYAKIPPSPKMFTPISLFQMWKLLKNFPRHTPLNSAHDIRRGNIWWCRTQNVNMILADNTTQNVNFKPLTGLSDEFSHSQSNIPLQYVVSVLRHPNKMIFYFVLCMTVLPIVHAKDYKTTAGKMLPV